MARLADLPRLDATDKRVSGTSELRLVASKDPLPEINIPGRTTSNSVGARYRHLGRGSLVAPIPRLVRGEATLFRVRIGWAPQFGTRYLHRSAGTDRRC